MRRLALAVVTLICGTMLLNAQSAVKRLQDVKTIYVAPLDSQDATVGNLISAKLMSYLAKHRAISVVESAEKADAILTGTGQVQTVNNVYGHPSYRVQAAMRLDNKDGVVLWADDVASSRFATSASSSFAENVAKRLVQAIVGDGEKRTSGPDTDRK